MAHGRKIQLQTSSICSLGCGQSTQGHSGCTPLNPHSEPITLHGKATITELTELDSVLIVTPSAGVERAGTMSEEKCEMLWNMVKNCGSELTLSELDEVFELLLSYGDTFAEPEGNLGRTDKLKHTIFTGEAQPIRQGVRRIPLSRKTEVTKLVKEILDKRIITQSSNP